MNNLIISEFRKITTTKTWWALLIPIVIVAVLMNWIGSALSNNADVFKNTGQYAPFSLITITFAFVIASYIISIFGIISVGNEFRHRTITASLLIAPSRTAFIGAKVIVVAGFGAFYGVVIAAFSALGATFAGLNGYPPFASMLVVSLAGIIYTILWTVLGAGIGAIIPNQVGAILGTLGVRLIGELILSSLFAALGVKGVGDYLPGGSGTGSVFVIAIDRFLADWSTGLATLRDYFPISSITDVLGSWWVPALVFLAYSALIGGGGWYLIKNRDIS
jgi:hypothetical protein